ncbi:hypothetical protein N7466_002855 [Penicillium verhagenii]|uniref:uncharacterized protein n=1 Tax=Penicillium verhagenii TaxID=1562060 RepID=UPI0025459EE4|nr:uncharacterized protein N7466_002855 [Penicillium verhagenii]KAJ5939721.1 hypothetical protein N7466_002855 [Penicillium verhagenii]
MEGYAPQFPNSSKVAIPRESNTQIIRLKGRVSRACDTCRGQKAKCSGQRPACQRCRQSDMTCIYSNTKGDRDAKQFADLTSRTQICEGLLRNLHPYLDRQLAIQVEKLIDGLPVTSPMILNPSPIKDVQEATNNPIKQNDHTVEDRKMHRISQATGFVGRPSESGFLSPLLTNNFLDDTQVLAPNSTDNSDYPSENAATQLVECYFQNAHASFPLISKLVFLEQFRRFYANADPEPGRKWIAILNMILAIASRHSSLVRKQPRSDLPYFTRAWELYTRDFAVLEHPSLQQVQIESLISLYLLSVGQINRLVHLFTAFTRPGLIRNRASRMCGIALRSAVAMEIHLPTQGVTVITASGKQLNLFATREVIVSEGVFETPKLLMLSGIGPAKELAKHDIDIIVNSPYVGQHLLDHPGVPFVLCVKDGYRMDDYVLRKGPKYD